MRGLFKKALFLLPSQTKKLFTRINDDREFLFYLLLYPNETWELMCYKNTGEQVWRGTNLKKEDVIELIGDIF